MVWCNWMYLVCDSNPGAEGVLNGATRECLMSSCAWSWHLRLSSFFLGEPGGLLENSTWGWWGLPLACLAGAKRDLQRKSLGKHGARHGTLACGLLLQGGRTAHWMFYNSSQKHEQLVQEVRTVPDGIAWEHSAEPEQSVTRRLAAVTS